MKKRGKTLSSSGNRQRWLSEVETLLVSTSGVFNILRKTTGGLIELLIDFSTPLTNNIYHIAAFDICYLSFDIMRLDKEQQYSYNRYLDYLHYKASEALSLKAEQEEFLEKQIERAREDQKMKEKLEIAKNSITAGLTNEIIIQITGLTLEQIQALRNEK